MSNENKSDQRQPKEYDSDTLFMSTDDYSFVVPTEYIEGPKIGRHVPVTSEQMRWASKFPRDKKELQKRGEALHLHVVRTLDMKPALSQKAWAQFVADYENGGGAEEEAEPVAETKPAEKSKEDTVADELLKELMESLEVKETKEVREYAKKTYGIELAHNATKAQLLEAIRAKLLDGAE